MWQIIIQTIPDTSHLAFPHLSTKVKRSVANMGIDMLTKKGKTNNKSYVSILFHFRQLRVCNWFLTKFCFCCPCAAGPDPRRHPAYSQSMTCSTMGDVTMTSRQELSERYGRDSIHAKEKNVLLRDLQEEMAC